MKIGFLIIATGPYKIFFEKLRESILENFMTNHEKIFFYFTDDKSNLNKFKDVVKIPLKNLGFPKMTLFRYKFFSNNSNKIKSYKPDYLFYLDVDMLIVDKVEDDILPKNDKKLLAVFHPGFYNTINKIKPHETNKKSNFFVPSNKRVVYVAGGFQGGITNEYLKTSKELSKLIDEDFSKNIIPVWHDESAFNWYLTKNVKKIKFITPEYCYPECHNEKKMNTCYRTIQKLKPKILALEKDNEVFQK